MVNISSTSFLKDLLTLLTKVSVNETSVTLDQTYKSSKTLHNSKGNVIYHVPSNNIYETHFLYIRD